MKKRREYDDDDGRVIAPMNVDGMPWYVRRSSKIKANEEGLELSKEERRAFYWGVIKASLVIALAFIGGFTLIILLFVFIASRVA